MIGTGKHFILVLVSLSTIHDAVQTPLKPLESRDEQQVDDEEGSLSSEDFTNALAKDFEKDKPIHDEDDSSDLFEGDITGDKEQLRMLAENREVVGNIARKWPKDDGIVTVPYTFPGSASKQSRSEIAKVIDEYKTKTCIRLVKRSNEKNYVHLDTTLRGHRCSSPLGMIGRGKQTINFGEDCTWGNLAHEFMHSLGFFHEHTRSDRDEYMWVNWKNIEKYEKESGRQWKHNFVKCTESGCSDLKVGYDYGSIMHYGKNLGGKYPVLIPKEENVYIGQRNHLSKKDIQGINEHYCAASGTCKNKHKDCTSYQQNGYCYGKYENWMANNCNKACGYC